MKNPKKIKSLLCLLLSLLMLFTVVSCKDGTKDPEETKPSYDNGGDTNAPSQDEIMFKPAEKYYNRTLTLMARKPEKYDVANDDLAYSGTVLDQAVWERNAFMWEEFGVDIVVIEGNDTDYQPKALAGDYVCDFLLVNATKTFSLMTQNLLVDFNSLDSLNLEAPYWDQRIQEQYKVGDRLYTLEGDYTYLDEFTTQVVLFNDNLYTDYGYYEEYGSLYDLVRENKWTMSKMASMIKDRYSDVDNDQEKDLSDSYGLVTGQSIVNVCFLGSGMRIVESNNGELTLNIGDGGYYGRFYDVVEDCVSELCNKEYIFCAEVDGSGISSLWTDVQSMFASDRALFRMALVSDCVGGAMGTMKSRFGVVPIPAYEENTGNYYSLLPDGNHHPLSMAYNVKDREETAEIMEVMCYYSRYGGNTIYDAYFETFRLQKVCSTEDDLEMLSLIEDSKCYDLAGATNFFDLVTITASIQKAGHASNLSSTLQTAADQAQTKMEIFLEAFSNLS